MESSSIPRLQRSLSSYAVDGKTAGEFERRRLIMISDFPPIGVVKSGNVPNTMKSDPGDMQSMVRFLLDANELVSANRGLNDPEDPTGPSWGGQYARKPNTIDYVDGPGGSSISKWREVYQEEFQERVDWMLS